MPPRLAKIGEEQQRLQRLQAYKHEIYGNALPAPGPTLGISKSQQEGSAASGGVSMGGGVATAFTPLIELINTVIDYLAATDFPSVPEVIATFVQGGYTRPEYECFMRLNGADPQAYDPYLSIQFARPSDDQILILDRKAQTAAAQAAAVPPIPGAPTAPEVAAMQQTVSNLYAANGWTNPVYLAAWKDAQKWVPSPSDVIQWMIKDVADPQIQQTFVLGAEFRQKYTGHVKDVFDWNGISEEDANLIWRAHWRNISPHQLYEMHKRLRPGWTKLMSDEEVTALFISICPRTPSIPGFDPLANRPVSNGYPVPVYCEELLEPVQQRLYLESLATTGYHVNEALGQDDYPAFWRPRLLAISYNLMGRTDLRRAYEINQITFDRLVAGYENLGFDFQNANTLATFTRNNAIQLHARRPVSNQWVASGYDSGLLRDSLIAQGMRPDMWDTVFGILKTRRAIRVQKQCIDGTKRGYLLAMLTPNQALDRLKAQGMSDFEAAGLIEEWNCVKESKSRSETAAQICYNFKLGLMTAQEATTALRGLNYTLVQAKQILATCYIKDLPKTMHPGLLPQALQKIGPLN